MSSMQDRESHVDRVSSTMVSQRARDMAAWGILGSGSERELLTSTGKSRPDDLVVS